MKLAGVTATQNVNIDQLLSAVASKLRADGFRLVGALRPVVSDDIEPGQCNSNLWLLPDGPLARITQDLGAGSTACRMDAGAFEEAVGIATRRLQSDGADIVLLNKFGVSEAEGRGFRTLIAEALAQGIPELTGLSATHRAAFDRFAESMATILDASEEAVLEWCRQAAEMRETASMTS